MQHFNKMEHYLCPACKSRQESGDTHPDYHCGFTKAGKFTPKNWNCATLNALAEKGTDSYGVDQTVTLICNSDEIGMVALSRYKRRGRVAQAVRLDIDEGPTVELTYKVATDFLRKRI